MSAMNLGDSAVVKDLIVNGTQTVGTQTVTDLTVENDLKVNGVIKSPASFAGDVTCLSGTQTFKTTQADSLFLTTGSLDINGLATANPGIGGRVWNDGGTLKIA
tara:strand:+ start:36 stop:347 length:312 start_codon:yes stop_codon:yes gene_type:complete